MDLGSVGTDFCLKAPCAARDRAPPLISRFCDALREFRLSQFHAPRRGGGGDPSP